MTNSTDVATPPASPTPAATETGSSGQMSRRQVMESLSGILLGMFVSVIAMSVVSSSLPKIVTDLAGSQSSYTWVVVATLLTSTITVPIWGKLADLYNRKTLVQIALSVSVLSAAAAGFSQDVTQLIAARAFQGIGAGGLQALSVLLIADIVSPRERGKYMGLVGAFMGVGMVGGPILGGFLTDTISWRWNFFVGLPFAIASIITLQATLKLPKQSRGKAKVDILGATLIAAGIASLLLWITFAGSEFDWISWQTAAMVGGSLLALVAAVVVELHVPEPLIPMHLFRNRTLVLSVIGSVSVGVAMFGTSVFLSQYMQLARGKTPTESGLLTIPMVAGMFLTSTVVGQIITRTGRYKVFMIAGGVSLTGGLLLLSTIDYRTSLVLVGIYLFLLGAGVGMLMQNMVLATQNTLHIKDSGSGTALVAFFRSLGGAVGVSALGAMMGSRVETGITEGIASIAAKLAEAGVDLSQLSASGGALPDLSTMHPLIRDVIERAYGDGIADLFLFASPLAVVALICVILMREVPLGNKSGAQQMEELRTNA